MGAHSQLSSRLFLPLLGGGDGVANIEIYASRPDCENRRRIVGKRHLADRRDEGASERRLKGATLGRAALQDKQALSRR